MTDSKIQRLSGELLGFCGAAGAGKDAAAAMLPGARTLAFADPLYKEAAVAFGVTAAEMKDRRFKESAQLTYALERCADAGFARFAAADAWPFGAMTAPRSPRWVLQRWGDYRRSQDPDYFVKVTRQRLVGRDLADKGSGTYVLTDCRFANEVAMLRAMGGKLVQVVRPGVVAGGTGHASDTDGSQFATDYVLHNRGSLEDLRAAVAELAGLTQAAA